MSIFFNQITTASNTAPQTFAERVDYLGYGCMKPLHWLAGVWDSRLVKLLNILKVENGNILLDSIKYPMESEDSLWKIMRVFIGIVLVIPATPIALLLKRAARLSPDLCACYAPRILVAPPELITFPSIDSDIKKIIQELAQDSLAHMCLMHYDDHDVLNNKHKEREVYDSYSKWIDNKQETSTTRIEMTKERDQELQELPNTLFPIIIDGKAYSQNNLFKPYEGDLYEEEIKFIDMEGNLSKRRPDCNLAAYTLGAHPVINNTFLAMAKLYSNNNEYGIKEQLRNKLPNKNDEAIAYVWFSMALADVFARDFYKRLGYDGVFPSNTLSKVIIFQPEQHLELSPEGTA